jgi:hypothetical protein
MISIDEPLELVSKSLNDVTVKREDFISEIDQWEILKVLKDIHWQIERLNH